MCPSSWAEFWIWPNPEYSIIEYLLGLQMPPIFENPITPLRVVLVPVVLLQISRLKENKTEVL